MRQWEKEQAPRINNLRADLERTTRKREGCVGTQKKKLTLII